MPITLCHANLSHYRMYLDRFLNEKNLGEYMRIYQEATGCPPLVLLLPPADLEQRRPVGEACHLIVEAMPMPCQHFMLATALEG